MPFKNILIRLVATVILVLVSACSSKDTAYGDDYRTFHSDGTIEYGQIQDSYSSDLVMYLAGNQFMAMQEIIQDFQKKNPDIKTIYVETIPPGQILKEQILKQGSIGGVKTSQTPDLYASVNLGHLKKLQSQNIMSQYMIYTHNKLELMVAKGNPKHIQGVQDLRRDDLVQSHPNPLTEGIFKFYGSTMLKELNIFDKVTGGKQCKGCWAVKDKTWFTVRHHRETPSRIENGQADVGIVWSTEVQYAHAKNKNIAGIKIPAPYNMAHKVGYAIGVLTKARNSRNAQRYLDYLSTKDAQNIYASFGFVKASAVDLIIRKIP